MSRSCNHMLAVVIMIAACHVSESYKVLMFPHNAKSHVFSMVAIANGLASRGHNVTVAIGHTMSLELSDDKIRERDGIIIERYQDGLQDAEALYDNLTLASLVEHIDVTQYLKLFRTQSEISCRVMLTKNDAFMKRLEEARFDLAVVDSNFFCKCIYLFPHRLGVPFATYSDIYNPLVIRVPWLPSFVPMDINMYSDRMTFFERLKNTAMMTAMTVIPVFSDHPEDVIHDYKHRYGDFGSLDDLASRSVLWLIPRDHVVDYARPTMPHVVLVGGLTIKRTISELPSTFRAFIDGAPNGTIVVSFGSIASSFPLTILEKLRDAFRKLDADGLRFVFRLKNPKGIEFSKNVFISKWIPQNDLLAEPSVRLFITHCGNNGLYESVYRGVPMIGFPLFGDQPYNGHRMEHKGFGVVMDIRTFRSDELVENVRRVISTKAYAERVSKASAIMRDDPQSPVERAVYWIEHVSRFGGDHLRSGGQDLPLYAYAMMDIAGVVLITTVVVVYIVWKVVRAGIRKCFGSRKIASRKEKVG